MPLFEYKCQDCDKVDEFLQKFSDPAPETCPSCGAQSAMHKVVSLSSFQLKGGGWYKDLYSSVPEGKSDAESSNSDTGSTKSSDEKPGASKSKESSTAKPATDAKATASDPSKKPTVSKKVNKNAA